MKSLCALLVLIVAASGQGLFPNTPRASLSGLTHDRDGKPVVTHVTVYELQVQDGETYPVARCGSDTDINGRFRCFDMPAGRYMVLARAPLPADPQAPAATEKATVLPPSTQVIGYLPAFYPGASTAQDAVLLRLRAGEEGYSDILMTPTPLVSLSGTIKEKPGLAVLKLSLPSEQAQLATDLPVTYTAATGEFRAEAIPPGSYVLSADWFDGTNHHWSSYVDVSSRSKSIQVEDVHSRVNGTLLFEEGSSGSFPDKLEMQCGVSGSKIRVTSKIQADGQFDFGQVSASNCKLQPLLKSKLAIHAVKSSGRELPFQTIAVSATPMTLEVLIGSAAGQLTGALSGTPDKYPSTGIVFQALNSGEFTLVKPDSKGSFQIGQMDPSEYRVCAWDNIDEVAYRSATVQAKCLRNGTIVHVEPGRTTRLELRLLAYKF